jgi:hypothetical protein
VSTAITNSTDQRVETVLKWIVSGNSESDIVEAIAEKWGEDQAKPLIVAALAKLADAGRPDPDTLRGWAIEATREIYRQAMAAGDLAAALAAVKQLARLTTEAR